MGMIGNDIDKAAKNELERQADLQVSSLSAGQTNVVSLLEYARRKGRMNGHLSARSVPGLEDAVLPSLPTLIAPQEVLPRSTRGMLQSLIAEFELYEPQRRRYVLESLRDGGYGPHLADHLTVSELQTLRQVLLQSAPHLLPQARKLAEAVLSDDQRAFRQALHEMFESRFKTQAYEFGALIKLWVERVSVFDAQDLDCLFKLAKLSDCGEAPIRAQMKACGVRLNGAPPRHVWGPEIDLYSMVGVSKHTTQTAHDFVSRDSAAEGRVAGSKKGASLDFRRAIEIALDKIGLPAAEVVILNNAYWEISWSIKYRTG